MSKFDCPRRGDQAIAYSALGGKRISAQDYANYCEKMLDPDGEIPGQDEWKKRDGELHCSYCGSLHPDAFMKRVENGDEIGPTDKNYKVYLSNPWGKFYTPHLSRAQAARIRELGAADKLNYGYPGYFYNGIYLHPEKEESEAAA